MVPIRENLLSKSKYDLKVPVESCAKDMKYIVVHNTANDASAANEVAYMIRNDSSTSFNAAVDDKEIVVGIPLSRGAFAAGQRDGNAHGIHIEICYSLSGGTRFDKAEKNAAEYIAKLLTERKWDISHVKKHQDFDGKYCPHRTLDKGWARFLKMIESEMKDDKRRQRPMRNPRQSSSIACGQAGRTQKARSARMQCWKTQKTRAPWVIKCMPQTAKLCMNRSKRIQCARTLQTHSISARVRVRIMTCRGRSQTRSAIRL